MNVEGFVQGMIQHTDACAAGEMEFIRSPPPGRSPHQEDVDMHLWFDSLSGDDKAMAKRLVFQTARSMTYAILMVLDHKMTIDDAEEKGELELYYKGRDGSRFRLNSTDETMNFEYYFKTLRRGS